MEGHTVRRLARLAGVSVRTLHHYDAIGLLKPGRRSASGYRWYAHADLLRLQQILFYRELDLPLAEIGRILDDPDFDPVASLRGHRQTLEARLGRLYIGNPEFRAYYNKAAPGLAEYLCRAIDSYCEALVVSAPIA